LDRNTLQCNQPVDAFNKKRDVADDAGKFGRTFAHVAFGWPGLAETDAQPDWTSHQPQGDFVKEEVRRLLIGFGIAARRLT
jgi:hypothetical protein